MERGALDSGSRLPLASKFSAEKQEAPFLGSLAPAILQICPRGWELQAAAWAKQPLPHCDFSGKMGQNKMLAQPRSVQ